MNALELFCGLGGFAAAVAGSDVRIVGALDQSPAALAVYSLNFPGHPARQVDLEKITAEELAGYGADLWWLSPPCQPYSVRGRQKDLDDPRAQSLVSILTVFADIPAGRLPRFIALENVAGFAGSQARERLVGLLAARGYQIRERMLCPTELGVPSRRPRYYLAASRSGFAAKGEGAVRPRPLSSYLDPALKENTPADLIVPPELVARFGDGFRILDADNPKAYATCFTSGYGKSLMHAGSYLRCQGGVRRFASHEIACLLGFPEGFAFPPDMPLRKRWQLLGNSLSITTVREILGMLPVVS